MGCAFAACASLRLGVGRPLPTGVSVGCSSPASAVLFLATPFLSRFAPVAVCSGISVSLKDSAPAMRPVAVPRDRLNSMSETVMTPAHEVNITDAARDKVRKLLEQEGRDDLRLRIAVQPGGCSGLIYQLFFDERTLDNDAVVSFDGVEVVVDQMSVPYLNGSTIGFEDTIQKQGFTIDNPNAQGSCACGDSFS